MGAEKLEPPRPEEVHIMDIGCGGVIGPEEQARYDQIQPANTINQAQWNRLESNTNSLFTILNQHKNQPRPYRIPIANNGSYTLSIYDAGPDYIMIDAVDSNGTKFNLILEEYGGERQIRLMLGDYLQGMVDTHRDEVLEPGYMDTMLDALVRSL